MKLSEIKTLLPSIAEVNFILPNGTFVPKHFHITEVGGVEKNFIDCGGTVRKERTINFQLWEAGDFDHRLAPQKLLDIIELSEKVLGLQDFEIEVEYQGDTIGKYDLSYESDSFLLVAKATDCLAKDNCGIPVDKLSQPKKKKISMANLSASTNNECTPGGGCC